MNKCTKTIEFGDDYGDNMCTFRCQLEDGHKGEHAEWGNQGGEMYRLYWGRIEAVDPEGDTARWKARAEAAEAERDALIGHITDDNKSVKELALRVVAFASQLEAWGHEAAAQEILTEILGGRVIAPDYYALQSERDALQAALEQAREALKSGRFLIALDRMEAALDAAGGEG